jgi:hypothetical protein
VSNDFADIEAPSVQAQVDPTTAKLGDLIALSIRVTHRQALAVESPAFTKNLGSFEVYASTRLPTEVNGDKAVERFQAALQNFTTGQQVLPGLEVPYRDPMGQVRSVKTPELTVTITEVPPGPKDKGDIRGIKGVIGPTAWSPWWWLVGVFLLSAGCYLLWRKRRRALIGPPPPPPVPADVLALEKLEKLAQTDWLATGKMKEYYIAISEILREYLEKGFQAPALERTTSELMRDLRTKSEIATERQAELRELLDTCDLVKFAKFRPDAEEAKAAHAAAVRFVEQTKNLLPPLWGKAGMGGTPHLDPPPQGRRKSL